MALAAGARLGQYEIVASLGAGGMGEVYRAHDPRLRRDVAIKILPNADPERRLRFEREARAVAALNHPNIVTIHSVEEADGIPFLTMELVEGKPLSDMIPGEGMPLERMLATAIPLANALSAAHEKGITHRDLKPANVMIGGDGSVKILDFGLAKLQEAPAGAMGATSLATEPITGEGRVVGTVVYMSPEQAEGRAIDARSDLFSFGVMLYEMATGHRPFQGDSSMSTIAAILRDQPRPITELRPRLPRELGRIVRRALAKDPEQRYQTAKDLRNDLKALQDDLASGELSIPAAPTSPAGLPVRWLLITAVVLAVMSVAALTLSYLSRRSSLSSLDKMTMTRLTTTGKVSAGVISPDGKYVAHVVSDRGESLWIRQVATSSNVQIVPASTGRYLGLAFSPDGNYIYFTQIVKTTQADLYRIPTLGGTPELVLRDIDSPVALSPDGARMAFLRGVPRTGEIVLMVRGVSADEKPAALMRRKIGDGFPFYSRLAWSLDGRTIAAAVGGDALLGTSRNARIIGIDAASGQERTIASGRWDSIGAVAWLADSSIVFSAIETGTSNFQVWRASTTDGSAQRVTHDLNTYRDVSASASAGTVLTVLGDLSSSISIGSVSDPSAQTPVTSGSGRYDGLFGLTWTLDGRIVFTSASGGPNDLWIMDADGKNLRQLTSDPDLETDPVAAPDGRSVVFVSAGARPGLWRLNLDGSGRTRITDGASDSLPHCLPDGSVVFTRLEPLPVVYKVAPTGGAPTRVGKPDWTGFSEAVSPDGRQLAAATQLQGASSLSIGLVDLASGDVSGGLHILNVPIQEQWTPRGDAITYLESRHEVPEIWSQPIDGGEPHKLLDFHGERIFRFAWSRDGRLAVSHGPAPTDIVLLSGIR